MARNKLYRLTDGDKAVIRKAIESRNPNWFLNHFLRSPYSGTYWNPVTAEDLERLEFKEFRDQALIWQRGYDQLADVWMKLGQPEHFAPIEGKWQALTEDEYLDVLDGLGKHYHTVFELNSTDPIFHHNHGFIMLPWQLDMNNAIQEERVVVGGFGSGKTLANTARMLYHAATLRGYRGFALAPNTIQAEEFHTLALAILTDTLYEEKFLQRSPTRPRPSLFIGHDHVGDTRIECIPVAKEPDKARTVTGDECVIDQAEKFDQEQLVELRRSMGTRFRGMMYGRPKVGTTTYLANSGDNPALWAMFDEAKERPNDVWAFSPPTVLNTYLTVGDLIRFERRVGDDEESKAMYLRGERPMASGEHFSAETLKKIRDTEATLLIKRHSVEQPSDILDKDWEPRDGYLWRSDSQLGCYHFETPYDEGRQYLVASDAGWNNPPKRDTPVVGVLDYTDFPYIPARLAGFAWVSGNHSPDPFLQQHTEFTLRYKAVGMNAFDATAQQAGYDRFLNDLGATPVSMGGNRKYVLLTLLKTFAARGLLLMPHAEPVFYQLSRYTLPDDRLVQDIVAMLMVAAHLLEPLYYAVYGEDGTADQAEDPEYFGDTRDRYARPTYPRYGGHRR